MAILRHWPTALLVFYWCLMSPMVFACEAILQLSSAPGFVERGVLGSKNTYVQRVYSGDKMSYSAIIFAPKTAFNKKSLVQQTAKSMISTVSAVNKGPNPQIQILNSDVLPNLDTRLAFLSYITYEAEGSINVEASASIRTGSCWSVLRFSALKKQTKDEALNQFATLIRATSLVQ
jgi:hypothetical protein